MEGCIELEPGRAAVGRVGTASRHSCIEVGAAPRAALVASGRVERPRSTAADRGGQPYLNAPKPMIRFPAWVGSALRADLGIRPPDGGRR